jgi:hypothetical protein
VNQEIKERWIKRLESGDNYQITTRLGNTEGGRCCLGVLCDIAVEDGVISAPLVKENGEYLQYDGQRAVLPEKVMEWAGLEYPNGGFASDPEGHPDFMDDALSFRNDSGNSFADIANIIRERF